MRSARAEEAPRLVRRVLLQSVAEAEVAEALQWYRQRSPAAGRDFLAAVDQTLGRIQQDPESLPMVSRTLRRALLPHFPYGIYYRGVRPNGS